MQPADGDDRPARRSVNAGGPASRLDRVLSQSLSDPAVLRAIAHSYAERNEWDAAAAVLREAVERTPDDRQLQFELGVAEARSGDYVAALMHLQQCGDLAVAHYNLGILLHEAGLREAAILAFRSALRYEPGLSQARVWLTELAPAQAAAAAAAAGRRPAMIGAPAVTPVEGQSTDGDDGAVEDQENSGIEIRPARARRVKKRD
jgi:tetratricopeptide (TPR) repeat protein